MRSKGTSLELEQRRRLAIRRVLDGCPECYVDAGRVADFLRDLLRRLRGRVIMTQDDGTNHNGPAIRAVLRRRRLSLEWLPSYAPELNSVEAL